MDGRSLDLAGWELRNRAVIYESSVKHCRGDVREDGMIFVRYYTYNGSIRGLWASSLSLANQRDRSKAWRAKNKGYLSFKKNEWAKSNRAKVNLINRSYHQRNKAAISEKRKQYRIENRSRIRKRERANAEKNSERIKAVRAEWRQKNLDRIKESARLARMANRWLDNERNRIRYATDQRFSTVVRLRSILNEAINRSKPKRFFELVGCSIKEFVSHIERQFKLGMTWENRHLWHIDHIKPFAAFDLTDSEQVKKAMHFTNLQPLWASENLSKGKRFAALN